MQDGPLPFTQVLAEEYKTLRGTDVTAASPPEFFQKTGKDQPLSALCISGGGIRSATFALGALQGLAEQGLLKGFDYLSTVSGGGYIGGWLTAWINRAHGLENVVPQLTGRIQPTDPQGVDPIEHLREYNNYLTPKLGFLSPDTWTLVATVFRNILLNWLVLVPLLMAALIIPRLVLSVIMMAQHHWNQFGSADAISKSQLVKNLPLMGGLLIAMAIFNIGRYLPGVGGRNHTQSDFLRKVLAPMAGAALSFITHESLYFWGDQYILVTPVLQVVGFVLLPAAAGWLAFLAFCGKPLRMRLKFLFGPLSVAVALMAISPGLTAWVITNKVLPLTSWAVYVTIGPPLLLLAFDLGAAIFVGLSSNALKDPDREWMARSSAWLQLFCVYWVAIFALVLLAPDLTLHWPSWSQKLLAIVTAVSAWASRLSPSEASAGRTEPKVGPGKLMAKYAIKAAPAVFVVSFAIFLSLFTNWLLYKLMPLVHSVLVYPLNEKTLPTTWTDHKHLVENTPWQLLAVGGLLLFGLSRTMAHFININKFSLHSMYRNRVIRAYLGASNSNRNTGRFTGFAENDNLLMGDLRTDLRPFHVVNITLNLVAGERLAWQQRKAQSFTVSPLHSGNDELGYRKSANYGGADGISLGTAVTISGAAASPSMGYHSSPIVGFIMTLLNARLGSWLGNPGTAGEHTWKLAGPRSAIKSLVREAFGLTNNTSSYVYLSDGGHFENLGLYEMVKRGCRWIVVLDSGADPKYNYDDLGNALRKIRIDMNVSIEFDDALLGPLRDQKKRCAMATIRYSELDHSLQDGYLIYIKPLILGNESPDVATYKASHPDFPHESTANQWFSESQTESYRILGRQSIREICQGWDGSSDLAAFRKHVAEKYLAKA
ncbi:MAG TPA: patatin-like phospholipase family protein [Candidatus Saccharimonadales bacterium]|jgi:hypothetical protein|nr:patatin-like phospholipase family protein [Candidatus Saccharimonadales bacterium]